MDKTDDWLKHLSKYLIERFTQNYEDDVPTIIANDFKMKEIFDLSNVSQIR